LKTDPTNIAFDPFRERIPPRWNVRARVLGGVFSFAGDTAALRDLVAAAYAGLPSHKFSGAAPRFQLRLMTAPAVTQASRLPGLESFAGARLLGGATPGSDLVVIAPELHSALIVVAPESMRFPYIVRYELIEFAVYTLATRSLKLVPLHAACLARHGTGVLLIGDSGAGKSTTVMNCLAGGWKVVSEDSVLVTPRTLLATGVANYVHVRCDSLQAMPRALASRVRYSPTIRRRSGVEKFEVDLRRNRSCLAPLPVRITHLVFLSPRQVSSRGKKLKVLRRQEALDRLQRCQPYAAQQPGWSTFLRQIAGIPAFELRRGAHPAQTVEALDSFTNN
jgi:hypothetical protein